MNKLTLTSALFVLCTSATLLLPAHAQTGTMKWHFKSRAEVQTAVRANQHNLRESYNIIICAARQGLIRSVVQTYEKIVPANPYDTPVDIASSYALAYQMMVGSTRWTWKRDRNKGLTKLSDVDGLKMQFYRDMALAQRPKSPEVLVSYAIWAHQQNNLEGRSKAVKLIQTASKYAPRWADLYYWQNMAVNYRSMTLPFAQQMKEQPKIGAAMLRALNTCERLDPGSRSELLIEKSTAYGKMGRHKEALALFDQYVRVRPTYVQYLDGYFGKGSFKRTRDALVAAAQKANGTP